MNEPNATRREQISALMDGCLQREADVDVLGDLLADSEAEQTWHTYQIVGDVLRSPELAPTRDDLAFWARLERRLALEPLRPQAQVNDQASVLSADLVPVAADTSREAANASTFRWKVLATVACVALAGVVGMGQWTHTAERNAAQLAVADQVVPVGPQLVTADSSVGTMVRDPRLDELIAAHRQLGGHSALQVPAGFLRNATYEGGAR